jgi:glutamate synthase (ferredoxin)
VSGYDGGTGAAPRTSIRHAGLPWELGVAEANQSLLQNQLRNRVTLETDGKLFTGRDVVVAALLGAEEFAFATAPLIAMGCDMLRLCNMNTCSVGIATQHPELRKNFSGKPEHIENFMRFVAREIREWMALLGVQRFDDLIGHVEYLKQVEVAALSPVPIQSMDLEFGLPVFVNDEEEARYWAQSKALKVDLSRVLHQVKSPENAKARYHTQNQNYKLKSQFDLLTLVPLCAAAIDGGRRGETLSLAEYDAIVAAAGYARK